MGRALSGITLDARTFIGDLAMQRQRIIRFVLLTLLVSFVLALPTSIASQEQSTPASDQAAESPPLSDEEQDILTEGLSAQATEAEKAKAEDICSEKCKVCHDGISCDFDCVRKTCLKEEGNGG